MHFMSKYSSIILCPAKKNLGYPQLRIWLDKYNLIILVSEFFYTLYFFILFVLLQGNYQAIDYTKKI